MNDSAQRLMLTVVIGTVPLATLAAATALSLQRIELPPPCWILAGCCATALLAPPGTKPPNPPAAPVA